jgi:hypothetical protein
MMVSMSVGLAHNWASGRKITMGPQKYNIAVVFDNYLLKKMFIATFEFFNTFK